MEVIRDQAVPQIELTAIDGILKSFAQLSFAGKRKLLSRVARQCLEEAEWTDVPLFNEEGRPFSYVQALPRPEDEFSAELTPAVASELIRRALTPEDSISWQAMLAQLSAEDDREALQELEGRPAFQVAVPTTRR